MRDRCRRVCRAWHVSRAFTLDANSSFKRSPATLLSSWLRPLVFSSTSSAYLPFVAVTSHKKATRILLRRRQSGCSLNHGAFFFFFSSDLRALDACLVAAVSRFVRFSISYISRGAFVTVRPTSEWPRAASLRPEERPPVLRIVVLFLVLVVSSYRPRGILEKSAAYLGIRTRTQTLVRCGRSRARCVSSRRLGRSADRTVRVTRADPGPCKHRGLMFIYEHLHKRRFLRRDKMTRAPALT